MTEPNYLPCIENVEPFEWRPTLRGLTIQDPAPLAEALKVFGVSEQELPDWKIYTSKPDGEVEDNGRTVILSPKAISYDMQVSTMVNGDRPQSYYEHFNSAASKIIISQLAGSVVEVNRQESTNFLLRNRSKARIIAGLCLYEAIEGGLYFGLSLKNPLLALTVGIGSLLSSSMIVDAMTSRKRAIKKLISSTEDKIKPVAYKLEKVILPIYTTRSKSGGVEPGVI